MLDTPRQILIKRAFIEQSGKTIEEVDALLAKQYGKSWKERYGVEEIKKADKVKAITPYTGKSQHEIEEERLKKEQDEALAKARKDWQKKQKAKARRAKARKAKARAEKKKAKK